MGITIPGDWPDRTWLEETPIGTLETVETPEVSGVVPERWQVASWSSTREMSSSALPGQVRAKTGLSVGTAKAVVRRDHGDYPWKQRDVYRLTGSEAQILLAPEGKTEIPTGQFRVAEVTGDLTTIGVQVDLDEQTVEGQDKTANARGWVWVNRTQFEDSAADPSWWIAELAKQMGYGVTMVPGEGGYNPVLDVPFQGSIYPAFPQDIEYFTNDTVTWGELDGVIALSGSDADPTVATYYRLASEIVTSVTVTADIHNRFEFEWDRDSSSGTFGNIRFIVTTDTIVPDGVTLAVQSTGANGTANTQALTNVVIPADPDRPKAVQVQFEVTASGGNLTQARARVRRVPGSAWSGWVTQTMTNTIPAGDNFSVELTAVSNTPETYGHSQVARVSVVDNATHNAAMLDTILSTTEGPNGRLYLEPLYGTITSPWLDPDLSVWGAMQAIVEAWQGALITDVYGDLRLLNRFSLTGVGTGVEIVKDVGLNFEDLPWVMNYTDQADRLVVKYRPAVVKVADSDVTSLPVIWSASEVIICYPGYTDVFFTLDYIYPVDVEMIPFIRKGELNSGAYHEWDAWRYNNGTGYHVAPETQLDIGITRVTSSTWKVTIRNLTNQPFHMVDNTGAPWLRIKSSYWLDQTQEATIERGASSGEARNPLQVDLSNYVQNAADANALADYLWGRVNQRTWRASTVVTVPDYRLDLGDVVELVHSRTGVHSNALVTKVDMEGEPGKVAQKLDLVLIPPTWEDFDEAWATKTGGNTWDDFDALWASGPYTWNDFDRAPTATTVAEIEGAM